MIVRTERGTADLVADDWTGMQTLVALLAAKAKAVRQLKPDDESEDAFVNRMTMYV